MEMISTILIPVDFKVKSLNTLKYYLKRTMLDRVNIKLMYCEHLSDSITDMLFYNPDDVINSHQSPEFTEALSILKNKFAAKLNSLEIVLFHGNNTRAMKNFLEANRVNEIYVSSVYKLSPKKRGFDPIPMFVKADIKFHEIGWNLAGIDTEEELLESLLFNYN